MHKAYENGEYRLYVSSKKAGSITIKYQGDCVFKLPYNLEPKKIYELVLRMETATLVIKTSPANAKISIDNEELDIGHASKAVSIGAEHRYKVECDNYYPKEDVVLFTSNEKKEIEITLDPNFGYITVKTTPSRADVYVDDKLVGKTPYLSEIISPGMHKITVNKEGYETAVKRLNINLNEEQNVEFELVEGESSMPVQQVVVVNQQPKESEQIPSNLQIEESHKISWYKYFCVEKQGNKYNVEDIFNKFFESIGFVILTTNQVKNLDEIEKQYVLYGSYECQLNGDAPSNLTFTLKDINGDSIFIFWGKGNTLSANGDSKKASSGIIKQIKNELK